MRVFELSTLNFQLWTATKMAHVSMDTNNPLGQRPFGTMGGLGWMGQSDSIFCMEYPEQCDAATMNARINPSELISPQAGALLNQRPDVLDALHAMGAITQTDVDKLLMGQESLTRLGVTMSMVNTAMSIMGKPGIPVQYTIDNAGGTSTREQFLPPGAPKLPDPCKAKSQSMTDWFQCHALVIGLGLAVVLVVPAIISRR